MTSSSLRPGGSKSRTLAAWPLDNCTENVRGVGRAIAASFSCWVKENGVFKWSEIENNYDKVLLKFSMMRRRMKGDES